MNAGRLGGVESGLFVFGGSSTLGPDDLTALHEVVSAAEAPLTVAWTELFGRPLEVTSTTVTMSEPDVSIEGSFAARAELRSAEVSPVRTGDCTALLVLSNTTGLMFVDLLLGGPGRAGGERNLSAIDEDLLGTVVAPTLEALTSVLPGARTVVLIASEDEDPDRPTEGVRIEWSVTAGENTASVAVIITQLLAIQLLGTSDVTTAPGAADDPRAVLQALLGDISVPVVIEFPPVTVPSQTVLSLGVGDVVRLGCPTDSVLSLLVDGLGVATVRPARSGTKVACQVTTTVARDPNAAWPQARERRAAARSSVVSSGSGGSL